MLLINKKNKLFHFYLQLPGICEPVNSDLCIEQQPFVRCEDIETYECPAAREDHVESFDLQFPLTPVPAVETSYFCTTFEVCFICKYQIILVSVNLSPSLHTGHYVVNL